MTELSLPERLVHAAEAAIQGAGDTYESPLGDKVDGYSVDFARVGGAALIDVLTEDLQRQVRCPDIEGGCVKCRQLRAEIEHLRVLAQAVRDVPAVTAA